MLPIPTARIPRQHQLARRIRRVEINVGIQGVARLHLHGRRGIAEVVLVKPGKQSRLMRQAARVRRRISAYPDPVTGRCRAGRRAGWQRVVYPGNIVAVVIGDRQRGLGHGTQDRAAATAQRQYDDFTAFDHCILEDRNAEGLAVFAVGETQGAIHGTVVDARRRAEIARRVVDREATTGTSRAIDRNDRCNTRFANTISGIAESHHGGRRRFVCTGIDPDIIHHPAERSTDRAVGGGMPAEADTLANQDTEIEARRDITVAFITEGRVVGIGIGRVIVECRVVGLATVDERSGITPGCPRVYAVFEKTAVPIGQFQCIEIERRLKGEGVLEVQVWLGVRGQRHIYIHLCRPVGTDETVTTPKHEVAGSRITEVVDPRGGRAAGDIDKVPLASAIFEIIKKEIVGGITADTYGSVWMKVFRVSVHFHRINRGLNVQAIDTGDAVDAYEILAGLA